MSVFLSLFTRNWWLKLIALALALIVFYVVRGQIRNPRPNYNEPPGIFMKGTANASATR